MATFHDVYKMPSLLIKTDGPACAHSQNDGPALEATTPEQTLLCGDFAKLDISVPGQISAGFPDGGA